MQRAAKGSDTPQKAPTTNPRVRGLLRRPLYCWVLTWCLSLLSPAPPTLAGPFRPQSRSESNFVTLLTWGMVAQTSWR